MDRAGFAAWVNVVGAVATRKELVAAGVSAGTIANRIKYGEWQRPFPAVFFLFPNPPTWEQRLASVQKWVAGRGVFSHQTAAYLHGLRSTPPTVLDVLVPSSVGLRSTSRCTVRRTNAELSPIGSPPRTPLAQTVADLINEAGSKTAALELLMLSIQRRLNLVEFQRLVEERSRMRHRDFIRSLIAVTGEGVESHLEFAHRRKVERAHGLPPSARQKWQLVRGRWIRADGVYQGYRVRIELDGELAHPGRTTDSDLMRDNAVRLASGEITLRYRWWHVWNTPCEVAGQTGAALRLRGWRGRIKKCSPGCAALDVAAGYLG